MTNGEALSLLGKIDVEQKTMKELWGQFSTAISQIRSLITHVEELQAQLPKLEADVKAAKGELDAVTPKLASAKKAAENEAAQFRKVLDAQLAEAQQRVSDAGQRVSVAEQAADVAERQSRAKIEELDKKIKAREADLAKVAERHKAFLKSIGVG